MIVPIIIILRYKLISPQLNFHIFYINVMPLHWTRAHAHQVNLNNWSAFEPHFRGKNISLSVSSLLYTSHFSALPFSEHSFLSERKMCPSISFYYLPNFHLLFTPSWFCCLAVARLSIRQYTDRLTDIHTYPLVLKIWQRLFAKEMTYSLNWGEVFLLKKFQVHIPLSH